MSDKKMTPDDVAACVETIRVKGEVECDDEEAHALEDVLHQSVLRAIANGDCTDPAECAQRALGTASLKFQRWCA